MINRVSIFCTLLIAAGTAFSQLQRNTGQFSGGLYSGATVETFTSSEESYPDENYLQKEWVFGAIDLVNTDHVDIKQIPLKFNIVSNKIEIKTDRVVKEIPVSLIRRIEILDPTSLYPIVLINGEEIGKDSETLYEELNSEGRFIAYIFHSHSILPADYNPQFDTGSKVDRVVLIEKFLLRDKDTSEFYDIKLKKKSLIKTLGKIDESYAQKVKRYAGNMNDKHELRKLLSETQKL